MGEANIELNLLGSWELIFNGTPAPVASRPQRLITALAIYGRSSRSALSGLLWPDSTDVRAMGSLRAAVFTVSHRLPGLLVTCGRDLALMDTVEVDLHRARSALANASSTTPDVAGAWLDSPSSATLLPGWYDDWALAEQEHFRTRYLDAADRLARIALDRHDLDHAAHYAQKVLDLDPLRESAVRVLVETQLAVGNHAVALRTVRRYTERLAVDLGIRPSPQLSGLVAPLLRH